MNVAVFSVIVVNFSSIGLVEKQHERVKLHVTLMNTLFRREKDSAADERTSNERESFSARRILEVRPEMFWLIFEIGVD